MAATRPWNHNIHHHRVILDVLPARCDRVLDVGCGEGYLAEELSGRAGHVVAIDRDRPTVEAASRDIAADNIDFVVGDVLGHPFVDGSFDAVVSVATLHHMDLASALARLRDLLRPGGTLAVVGLARSQIPRDLPYDFAGTVLARAHRLTKTYQEVSAPMVWPPPTTYRETRDLASDALPGVRYRRHLLWRYSLVWTKPTTGS